VVNPVGVVIRQSHETPGSVSASVKVPVICRDGPVGPVIVGGGGATVSSTYVEVTNEPLLVSVTRSE
jgi:hypothetical protein